MAVKDEMTKKMGKGEITQQTGRDENLSKPNVTSPSFDFSIMDVAISVLQGCIWTRACLG